MTVIVFAGNMMYSSGRWSTIWNDRTRINMCFIATPWYEIKNKPIEVYIIVNWTAFVETAALYTALLKSVGAIWGEIYLFIS